MRRTLLFYSVSTLLMCTLALPLKAQLDKGDRLFAWQIDSAEDNDYVAAYNLGLDACMESTHITFVWSEIESNINTFESAGIERLDLINYFHPLFGVKAELNIGPVNTVAKEVPADLQDVAFDSPELIDRFKAVLDTVFTHLPDLELSVLNIGNEIDIFFGTNEANYLAYKSFLDEVVPYAQQLYFELHGTALKVGTVCTFDGLTSPEKVALCQAVNDDLDVVSVTYYPLNPDFTMESPEVVLTDFDDLVSYYSDTAQPIYFTECGYSSSSFCNSSEELQSIFFQNVFAAWDEHYDNIKYISIFKSTDWSQAQVDIYLDYYGIDVIEFAEYLRAIGVRTWDGSGTNKLAYDQIKCELEARNWCEVECAIQNTTEFTQDDDFEVYPNPSENILYLKGHFSSYRIVNSNGQVVKTGILQSNTLDLSFLDSGVYFVQVSNTHSSATKRFVKL